MLALALATGFGALTSPVQAQGVAHVGPVAKDVVLQMLAREQEAADHKQLYSYLSVERSDRTGGHLWTEHVVETPVGRIRFLLAEDGQPLSPDRMGQERGRLAGVIADPAAFEASEKLQKDDEVHARQMLALLPKAFILENLRAQGTDWRIDFRPDPAYSASGIEEKVLHGMAGYLLIDQKLLRLHYIEGAMPQDVSIGFGLLATIHAGSHFVTAKAPIQGQWRTVRVISDVRGKAALFKSIAKNQDVTRSQFHRIDAPLTIPQAVALAEQPPAP
jgi:hypothetical protein